MSYFNPFEKQDSISVYGYWLYDAGGDAAKLYFNLFDPGSYPFDVDNDIRNAMFQPLNWLSHRVRDNRMSVRDWSDQDNAVFISLISLVRKAAAKVMDIPNQLFLQPEYPDSLISSFYYYSREGADRRKHRFFLNIALLVIAAKKSLREAASYAHVDPRNILIWISMFLTWGFLPFEKEFKSPSEKEYREIINSHIADGSKVLFTCVKNKFFTRNKFRNFRRRHHPLRASPHPLPCGEGRGGAGRASP